MKLNHWNISEKKMLKAGEASASFFQGTKLEPSFQIKLVLEHVSREEI